MNKKMIKAIQGLVNMQNAINNKLSNEISDVLRFGYSEENMDGLRTEMENLLEEYFRMMK